MNPFGTPKAKKTAPSAPQRQNSSISSPVSSLVPCPICEKSIPEWFMNNHLDNECLGMESVAESLTQQSSRKRNHDDLDEFEDLADGLNPFQDSGSSGRGKEQRRSSFSRTPSTSNFDQRQQQHHQQVSGQSRKEQANAAVIRSMPLAERARPSTLDDYIGQQELVGPGGILRGLVLQDSVP
ncbi:hypothetical protein EDD21DRAFT_96417 [Dissophora ornata]|nr:hypothetical protein EDD21DRAFT_96417 [Dissophora ornata]